MHDDATADATLAAGDIARLAGVGRAAVSNWRRRFPDFPGPVGGTSANPLFSLAEVETWLRDQGKLRELPEDERVWQLIRNSADDLELASLVSRVAVDLVRDRVGWSAADEPPPRHLLDAAAGLAAILGTTKTVEFLYTRYVESHSRRVSIVPAPVAGLMGRLLGSCATVLDPHCGFGALLLEALPWHGKVRGQDRDPSAARFALARVAARGPETQIRPGDALLDDAWPEIKADGALCVPPFNERSWGYEQLTNDTRWQYGLPPRGESELAWVQHCLARVRPGGRVVMLMPPAAAYRRSGRRIRAQLLRTGALQAVIGLPAGSAPQSALPPHLWVLRRPDDTGGVPASVLMADGPVESFTEGIEAVGHPVPIIDLLDDDVDLTPARHLPKAAAVRLDDIDRAKEDLGRLTAGLIGLLPEVNPETRGLAMTTLAELLRAGAVQLEQTSIRMETESGPVPLLTAKDVTLGRGPTGRGEAGGDVLIARPGDIVLPAVTRIVTARVMTDELALGPHLLLVRVDQSVLDPHFVAGFLRVAAEGGPTTMSGTYRVDVRRARLPRLPLDEQRRYGQAFQQLGAFERAVAQTADRGASVLRQIHHGLINGQLRPPD